MIREMQTAKMTPECHFIIFSFVKTEKSPAKAAHFLQQIFDELGDRMDLDGLHRFFQRHYTDQEIDDVFAPGSDYDSGRSNGMAFYRRSGLQKLPIILVNGVPLDQSAVLDSPERFEEAIIVTVMRQTGVLQRAVISWLLNNYLSPQFKETLPVLAKHYGFDYQLIEYKWPRWFHQQTEKQRVFTLFSIDISLVNFFDISYNSISFHI